MSGNIAVVYEKGVLRPLTPLNLPERTRLEIRIVRTTKDTETEAEQAYLVLVQAGLIRPSATIAMAPISDSERRRAADAYGRVGPLSDAIIAERNEG
jgi:predicted DNA-binding antitoxin AbrB/MazE fold protein